MNRPEQVYTTYIKTTPEKLWAAITNPEFTRQYWAGGENISSWQKGADWQHMGPGPERTVRLAGAVVECAPPKRLVLTWALPTDRADVSRVTFTIEAEGDLARLTVVHDDFTPGSGMPEKVAWGWPRVISSLKSFLETGRGFDISGGCK